MGRSGLRISISANEYNARHQLNAPTQRTRITLRHNPIEYENDHEPPTSSIVRHVHVNQGLRDLVPHLCLLEINPPGFLPPPSILLPRCCDNSFLPLPTSIWEYLHEFLNGIVKDLHNGSTALNQRPRKT